MNLTQNGGHTSHGEGHSDGERRFRLFACGQLHVIEIVLYALLGLTLSLTAVLALCQAGNMFWQGVLNWHELENVTQIAERLLFVLMLVEIIHTVRISIQHQRLVVEPFLLVAMIATIRRMLVITMEGSSLSKLEVWKEPAAQSLFRASLIEMALLAVVLLSLVGAIVLLRRCLPQSEQEE